MKKLALCKVFPNREGLRKMVRIMKFTWLFILIGTLQISASVYSQQTTFNVEFTNASLYDLMLEIKNNSEFDFVYSDDEVQSIRINDAEFYGSHVEDILNECLEGTAITYKVEDKVIILMPAPPKPVINTPVQKKEVKGTVVDEDGIPLPGVSVVVKGTNIGAATDIDGNYLIKFDSAKTLVYSFVGMTPQEVAYTGQSVINVTLKADTESLSEIVVTGFQTVSKERSSGSFAKVDQLVLDKPASDPTERLVGVVSGVQQVVDAQGNTRFEIRGQSAIQTQFGSVSEPLVVVDGFPIEGDLSSVNPSDIESITVLKDAAAASIWGARSGNGVIVVSTKKAKKETKTRVEISSFWRFKGMRNLKKELNRLSSSEQIDLEKYTWLTQNDIGRPAYLRSYALPSNSINDIGKANLSEAQVAMNEFRLGNMSEGDMNAVLNRLRNQDNLKQIEDHLMEKPFTQQYNVAISGGTKDFTNRLSLLFEDVKTDYKKDNMKRYMANYNMSYDLNKNIRLSFNSMLSYKDDDHTGSGARTYNAQSPLDHALNVAPYQMLVNSDGSLNRWTNGPMSSFGFYSNTSTVYKPLFDKHVPTDKFTYADWTYNPIEELNSRKLTSKTIHARIQAGLNVKIIDGLDWDAKVMYEHQERKLRERYYEDSFEVRMGVNYTSTWDQAAGTVSANLPKGEFLDRSTFETKAYNVRNQLNFDKEFGKHRITALAGTEISKRTTNIMVMPRAYGYDHDRMSTGSFPNGIGDKDFLMTAFLRSWRGPVRVTSPYPNGTGARFINSFDGFRVNPLPGYNNTIYFSLYSNFSYTFDHKYSLTGSIRTDASNFISDDPKYRYSPFWSIGGNWQMQEENFMQSIDWLDRLAVRASYGVNGIANKESTAKTVVDISPTRDPDTGEYATSITRGFGNPNLRWEKVHTLNLGLDYSMFAGKLYGSVEYYYKHSKDLIAQVAVPSYAGTTIANLNAVEMKNSGVDITIGSTLPIKGNDIVWTGNLNVSYNNNEITKMLSDPQYVSSLVQGGSSAYMEGYNANSLWSYKYGGMENGKPMLVDKDGNKHDATNSFRLDGGPLQYSYHHGVTVAPYTAGLNTNLKFYNFNLGVIITGKFGHKFRRSYYNFGLPTRNQNVSALYRKAIKADPNKAIPMPTEGFSEMLAGFGIYSLPGNMDYTIADASHIRFQEISLSYDVPKNFLNRTGINSLRVYGQVNNVGKILFNKYDEDPEYRFGNRRAVFTFGLKCNL